MPPEILPRTYRNSQEFSPYSFSLVNYVLNEPGARIFAKRTHLRRRRELVKLSVGDLAP